MPLSARQLEYLALAWQCFETEPKIDYEKFKVVAGLASANSARELMRVTKNKLKTEYGALSDGVATANGKGDYESASPAAAATTPKKAAKTSGVAKTPVMEKKRGRKSATEDGADAGGKRTAKKGKTGVKSGDGGENGVSHAVSHAVKPEPEEDDGEGLDAMW